MISVRSYLTVGTAAVVGAGAIALTPALPGQPLSPAALPAPAIAEIALTGFSLPATDIIGVLQTLGGLGGSIDGLLSVFLPDQLINAVFTEIAGQALPLLTTAAGDVLGYLGTAVTGLLVGPDSIPARIGAAIGDIPTVLTSAVAALSAGDLATAVQTVTTGLAAPLTEVGQTLADAAEAFQDFLNSELNTVVNALPGIILAAIQTVVGGNVATTLESITSTLSGLLGGLLPAAAESPTVSAAAAEIPATPRAAAALATGPAESGPVGSAAADSAPADHAPASPAAGGGAQPAEPQPAEPQAPEAGSPADPVSPVTRARSGAQRPGLTESATAGAAVTAQAAPGSRARAGGGKPSAASASRAAKAAG
ncbi:MAG: hypothetical protein KDB56_06345 [Mycobacterium sp.]|nr:hypothetical protein [Mycobacterium sp.]